MCRKLVLNRKSSKAGRGKKVTSSNVYKAEEKNGIFNVHEVKNVN